MAHPQDIVHQLSIRDPEAFWQHHAQAITWHTRPSRALSRQKKTLPSGTTHDHWSWFPDGELSTTYNCVDRHVREGRGDNVAIIWESPVSGRRETYTYRQVLEEVEVLAGVLHEQGVRKGDVVVIYSKSFFSFFPLTHAYNCNIMLGCDADSGVAIGDG